MSMTKDKLEKAIRDFFGDTSRPAAVTKDELEEISELAAELASVINLDDE